MRDVTEKIIYCMFAPSDPVGIAEALVALYACKDEWRACADSATPYCQLLNQALDIAVDGNDRICIMLLFSPSRAKCVLDAQTALPPNPKRRKGLALLKQLYGLPEGAVEEVFGVFATRVSANSAPLKELLTVFANDIGLLLESVLLRRKIARSIASQPTQSATKKI